MATTESVIEVAPGSELDQRLAESDGRWVVLVRDGVRYRVEREDVKPGLFANYDPERVLRVLDETAGSGGRSTRRR